MRQIASFSAALSSPPNARVGVADVAQALMTVLMERCAEQLHLTGSQGCSWEGI